jgi:hypothetical protein
MKKFLAITILAIATASIMSACSDVGTTSDESSSSVVEETTAAATTISIEEAAAAAGLDEIPTDRVPEIQAADSFEFDVIDGGAVITGYTGDSSDVEIPSEIDGTPVVKIGSHSFEANYNITSVVIPESVTVIGESAFMDCGSLESVDLPETLTEIQRAAFSACTSLTEITIPESVTLIYEEAFTACEALTSFTIENPDIVYYNWGLDTIPDITVYAPEGSSAAEWAAAWGFTGSDSYDEEEY